MASKFCVACGTENDIINKFCRECGGNVFSSSRPKLGDAPSRGIVVQSIGGTAINTSGSAVRGGGSVINEYGGPVSVSQCDGYAIVNGVRYDIPRGGSVRIDAKGAIFIDGAFRGYVAGANVEAASSVKNTVGEPPARNEQKRDDQRGGLSAFGTTGTDIEIAEGVTEIAKSEFEDRAALLTVKLPSTLLSIGERAFLGCKGLSVMDIPRGVKKIESFAFMYCNGIHAVFVPSTVERMGSAVFDMGVKGGGDLTIYCEHAYKPPMWAADWDVNRYRAEAERRPDSLARGYYGFTPCGNPSLQASMPKTYETKTEKHRVVWCGERFSEYRDAFFGRGATDKY